MRCAARIPVQLPLIAALTIIAACGGDTTTMPDDTGIEVLAEGTVGPGGGELTDDDVVLTIPAGALGDEAELALYADATTPPLGPETTPVYRLAGLPEQLDAPVTVRVRHGGAPSDSLALFVGELRHVDGDTLGEGGQVWFDVACRDSSGWAIATLDRGPVTMPGKAEPELKFVVIDGIAHMVSGDGHFEVVWGSPQNEYHAGYVAEYMEWSYDQVYALGFHFGEQDTIYPLKVYLRKPPKGLGEYVYGRFARGFFDFDPALFGNPQKLHQALIHEVFHHAQQFYDPRPPQEWISLNHARTWLDEASSSWIEEKTYPSGDVVPIALNDYVWTSIFGSGLVLPSWRSQVAFGYAMSLFVKFLVGTQGEERIREIYEAFLTRENAAAAIDAVADPPLGAWLADWHRLVVLDQVYADAVTPDRWRRYGRLAEVVGGSANEGFSINRQVGDYGSTLFKFEVTDETEPPASGLGVRLDQPMDISVFGHSEGDEPVLLTYAPDSLLVGNLPALLQTYDDFLLLVSRPTGTGPAYDGSQSVWIDVGLADTPDFSRFETAIIGSRYHAFWSDGEVPWQGLNFSNPDGVFNGNTYNAVWDSTDQNVRFHGQMTIAVHPDTRALMSWSATSTWDYGGETYNLYEMSGGGLPLESESENQLRWSTSGPAMCDVVSHIYVKVVQEGAITRELDSWTCDEDSYLNIRVRDER